MGMSTRVVGFRSPDEKFLAMKKVWDTCEEAGVAPPQEVSNFFDGERPDPVGIEVDLRNVLQRYSDDYSDGFELRVADIPKSVTVVRFINSW